jgi:hypothetical protein
MAAANQSMSTVSWTAGLQLSNSTCCCHLLLALQGMLLSIGGFSGTSTLDADAYRVGTMSDRIAMLDINSGK